MSDFFDRKNTRVRSLILPSFFMSCLSSLKMSGLGLLSILLMQAVLVVLLPMPIRRALDQISNINILLQMVGISLALTAISLALDYIEDWFHTLHIKYINQKIRLEFFDDIMSSTYQFYLRQKKINLVGIISSDVTNLEFFIHSATVIFVRSLPSLLFLFVALWLVSSKIAIGIAIALPIFYFISSKLSNLLKESEKQQRKQTQVFEDSLFQIFNSWPLIKSLAAESSVAKQIESEQEQLNSTMVLIRRRMLSMNMLFNGSRLIARVAMLLVGGIAIANKQMSLGELFVIASYLDSLQKPIFEFANFFSRYPKAMASIERLEELRVSLQNSRLLEYEDLNSVSRLITETEKNDSVLALELKDAGISFNDNSEKKIPFWNVNLKIQSGESVAIVGPSGAGKSTLLKALNRLLPLTSGEIVLNGKSIKEIDLKSLRSKVRVILQENLLLPTTIKSNLLLGSQEIVSDQQIWDALESVNASEFVNSLPGKLDCVVGEGGHPLSGGQLRRLCLARAFINLEKVLVLAFDEPTSGLDPISADKVIASIVNMKKSGQIVFWTTHRMSETDSADRVIKVDSNSNVQFLNKLNYSVDTTNQLSKISIQSEIGGAV